jgi:hypothetical protein
MVISVVMAVGLWPTAAGATSVSPGMSAIESAERQSPAGKVVDALTGTAPEQALEALPADFGAVLHYQPQLLNGRPSNPGGACSSPIPLPDRFEDLCRTHDFGYDMLRYAQRHGQPLGPWARTSLDRMLIDSMHESCSNPACHWAADLARVGLAFNTWRQHAGAPVSRESLPAIVMTSVLRGGESLTSLVGLT